MVDRWATETEDKRDKLYKKKLKNVQTAEYTEALVKFNELHNELFTKYVNDVEAR